MQLLLLKIMVQSFDYGDSTGILTVYSGTSGGPFTYQFDIGSGYDKSMIEIVDPDFGTGIINIPEGGLKDSSELQ